MLTNLQQNAKWICLINYAAASLRCNHMKPLLLLGAKRRYTKHTISCCKNSAIFD